MMRELNVPVLSLVVLLGASGSGKSTFARRHFLPTEVISSDACRALVCDDEGSQAATQDAFEVLHFIAGKRLKAGKLTVIDATNVRRESRAPLVQLARHYHAIPVALVLDLPERVCADRNRLRPDRNFGPHVVHRQCGDLRQSLRGLEKEGFRHVFILKGPEEVEGASITRVPLWNDRREEHGPFDIIGDIHGCCDELDELLAKLGYRDDESKEGGPPWDGTACRHPEGRKVLFLGDIVDRGPRILDSLKRVHAMVKAGSALCVPGNHDMKLFRKLKGRNVQITHGLESSLGEIEAIPAELQEPFCTEAAAFFDGLVSHYVLDGGKLVVAHAGMKETMQGRGSGRVRDFALYGETTGETDEYGLPVRCNWALDYRGRAMVVYGHTPVQEPEWLNNTVNIDTGCVFGGALTALRYPEKEFVSVRAHAVYYEPAKPFIALETPELTKQQQHDDLLDAADVIGKRIISTRFGKEIIVREENAAAALEVMSRFAANPQWLIYLPPTMSPCATSNEEGFLERPEEAIGYYASQGIEKVVCEEKHMGSRSVIVVCRYEDTAKKRFGIAEEARGIIYTRSGRRFFEDGGLENELLGRIRNALDASGFWEDFKTDWVCLDCELMPWSAKALELLRTQYAAVGASAEASLDAAVEALEKYASLKNEAEPLRDLFCNRKKCAALFRQAYRRYCWNVSSADDYRIAPFHILATEESLYADRTHLWHMEALEKVCREGSPLLIATPYRMIETFNDESVKAGIAWWEELTGNGGEGMVVKPLTFLAKGKKGYVQPALKVRGREYLRIIYGPEYTAPMHLERLRHRGLSSKRTLALQEFFLGLEALERFINREPLRRVHECVFAVLAMESEPVDPRL